MKKKRKHSILKTIGKVLLTLVLFALAGLCIAIMVYFGQHVADKTKAQVEEVKIQKEQQEREEQERLEAEAAAALEAQLAKEKAEQEERERLEAEAAAAAAPVLVGDAEFTQGFNAFTDESTVNPEDNTVASQFAMLINVSDDHVLVDKGIHEKMYPASMTKVLTNLIAAEQVADPEDTFTMTGDIINYSLSNGCNAAGYVVEEVLPVKDLFYGSILPSGGEATLGLATYVSESQDHFVELMNQRLEELGLSATAHFTNTIGLFDEEHYCTPVDMAMIMKAAVENDFCREVLSTKVYYTTKTPQNPEGLILSNWFLRRIEDRDCGGGEVLCGKTGFVNESGCCAVSYYVSPTGVPYICVTGGAESEWACLDDHAYIYKTYAP